MQSQINLSELYKSDELFLKDLKKVTNLIKKYHKYEGHLFDNGDILYEFLTFDTKVSRNLERLYLYAHINSDLDLKNEKYQGYYGKVINLFNELTEKTSFVIPEILSNDYSLFEEYLKENPKLKEYKLNIKNIFKEKKLIKSKEEERIISILSSTYQRPEEISELLINTDLDYGFIKDENGKGVHLTNSN